jgi:hypothetical protein
VVPEGMQTIEGLRDITLHYAYLAIPGRDHFDACIPNEEYHISSPDENGNIANPPMSTAQSITFSRQSKSFTPCEPLQGLSTSPQESSQPITPDENSEMGMVQHNNPLPPGGSDEQNEMEITSQSLEDSGSVSPLDNSDADPDYTPHGEVSDSDSSEYKSQTGRSRKRVRDIKIWKQSIQKRRYGKGKEYVSKSGKSVPNRQVKPVDCKCHYSCKELISEECRTAANLKFWQIGDEQCRYVSQRMFLINHVTEVPVRRRTTGSKASRRKSTLAYYLPDAHYQKKECVKMSSFGH